MFQVNSEGEWLEHFASNARFLVRWFVSFLIWDDKLPGAVSGSAGSFELREIRSISFLKECLLHLYAFKFYIRHLNNFR